PPRGDCSRPDSSCLCLPIVELLPARLGAAGPPWSGPPGCLQKCGRSERHEDRHAEAESVVEKFGDGAVVRQTVEQQERCLHHVRSFRDSHGASEIVAAGPVCSRRSNRRRCGTQYQAYTRAAMPVYIQSHGPNKPHVSHPLASSARWSYCPAFAITSPGPLKTRKKKMKVPAMLIARRITGSIQVKQGRARLMIRCEIKASRSGKTAT